MSETLGRERFETISTAARELVVLAAEVGIRKGTQELEDVDLDGFEDELVGFLDQNAEELVGASYGYLESLVRKSMFRDLDDSKMAATVSAADGPELLALAQLAVDDLQKVAEIKAKRDALERNVFSGLSRIARGALTMGIAAVLST